MLRSELLEENRLSSIGKFIKKKLHPKADSRFHVETPNFIKKRCK
jgi:hypothetical protein